MLLSPEHRFDALPKWAYSWKDFFYAYEEEEIKMSAC